MKAPHEATVRNFLFFSGSMLARKPVSAGGPLLEGFLHKKCRYAGVREGFPLKVILNDKIGLAGAKVFAMRQLHH